MIRILHLEDDLEDADLVARELRKANLSFSQTVVSTKAEFVRCLNECQPDIILSDHSLPKFNSLEALRIVKSKNTNVPFILITGNTSEEFAVSVIKEGADDYILKDRIKRLPVAIRNLLIKSDADILRRNYEREALENERASREKLEKLTRRLRLATKSAGMGIWEYDIASDTLLWDEGMCALYDISEDTVFDFEGWLKQLHADDIERVKNELGQVLKGEKDYSIEFRVIWSDSSIHYIKASGLVEWDNNGVALRIMGANWEITKDKAAEKQIQESETKYKSLIESSMDAILLTDKQHAILSANAAACAMFKMTEVELCSTVSKIVDPLDPRFAALLRERDLTGKAKGELNFVRSDGSTLLGEISLVVFANAYGEQRKAVTIRDISERKKTEEALKDSEAFSRGVLDSLSSHIAVINAKGTILKVNKPWNSFALENGSINLASCGEGANYFDVCKNCNEQCEGCEAIAGIRNVINGTLEEFYYEYPCHAPLEQRWFFMRVMKLKGAETLLLIEHQYITERKQAEQNLLNASALLQQALDEKTKIMDSSLDVICTVDGAGYFRQVSAASAAVWGYKPQELIGTSIYKYIHAEDQLKSITGAKYVLEGNNVSNFENRYIHKNGSIVPMEWSARWDEKDQLRYGVARDVTVKKQVEKALDYERRRIHDLFFQAPTLIGLLKGPEHVLEMANSFCLKVMNKQDVIGKKLKEAFPVAFQLGYLELLDEVYTTGIPYSGNEIPFRLGIADDGSFIDVYFNLLYQPFTNSEGLIEGIFFFAVDVTEQVIARKKIEVSEKKYRQIVETANEGIWMINERHQTSFVNQKMCEMLGYTSKELAGVPIRNFLEAENCLAEDSLMQRLEIGSSVICETELKTKTGNKLWVSFSTNPILNKEGNYAGALAMVMDITDRKLAEDLLIENQEQLLESQRIAHVGSWHLNIHPDLQISSTPLFCSDETFRIFGFPLVKKSICFHDFRLFIHADDRGQLYRTVEKTISSLSSCSVSFRISDKSGRQKWVHLQAKVIADKQTSQPVKIFGTLRDVTDRTEKDMLIKKNTEEREILIRELSKSLQDLKQFTFITSHNFRAPLSNLISLLTLVDTKTLTNDNREILEMFKTSTLQLEKTISDLISILIIKNNINVEVADIDIASTIDGVSNSLQHEINETGCRIIKNLQCSTVKFSKTYFESIMLNLISNAMKYRCLNRTLEIEISTWQEREGEMLLSIKDNGSGIDMKMHANKIFGLYQRFHTNSVGSGFGLFIVKSQITALGGEISVESEVDKGTTFLLKFKVNHPFNYQ